MKILAQPAPHKIAIRPLPQYQRGVVLIIALILLVVISLLAVTSIRNASSTASVAGNVRTTELATQAAEIALLYCETLITKVPGVGGNLPTYTFNDSNVVLMNTSSPPQSQWKKMDVWDAPPSNKSKFVLPLAMVVNQTGMTDETYKRPPECMVQRLPIMPLDSTVTSFVVTARGFGPEVEVGDNRPIGSEVWLQSHVQAE